MLKPSALQSTVAAAVLVALACVPFPCHAELLFDAETLIQASGSNITVTGYSVPSFVYWNDDSLMDLVVGEGGGTSTQGKVRVYLNSGTPTQPQFTSYFYAQSQGADLVVPSAGCLGAFPRVVYANADSRKDLLVGLSDGTVKLYLNTNTDAAPAFDAGTFLQMGEPGSKVTLNVGARATPTVLDWNNDEKRDLVIGGLDGKIRVYVNAGTDSSWDFRTLQFVQDGGADLVVPAQRSSPHVTDLDTDGKKDILSGDTEGQLLFYSNSGTDASPSFSGYSIVEADSVPINLPGYLRTRPFVCDWNGDGVPDVLVGAGDGLVRLYPGIDPNVGVAEGPTTEPAPIVRLLGGTPNPFNPIVTISFELTRSATCRLSVYDVSGRRLVVLADRFFPAGKHDVVWNGTDGASRDLSSGVYFVSLDADGVLESNKLVLLK